MSEWHSLSARVRVLPRAASSTMRPAPRCEVWRPGVTGGQRHGASMRVVLLLLVLVHFVLEPRGHAVAALSLRAGNPEQTAPGEPPVDFMLVEEPERLRAENTDLEQSSDSDIQEPPLPACNPADTVIPGDWLFLDSVAMGSGLLNPQPPGPPFFNLSCPAEFSRYSCAFMGLTHAVSASQLVFQPRECSLRGLSGNEFLKNVVGDKRDMEIWFVGDSLTRQMFISFTCMTRSAIVQWDLNWGSGSCPPMKQCITKGQHSGFNGGCAVYRHGARVCTIYFETRSTDAKWRIIEDTLVNMKPYDIALINTGFHEGPDLYKPFVERVLRLTQKSPGYVVLRENTAQHFVGHPSGAHNMSYWRHYSRIQRCKIQNSEYDWRILYTKSVLKRLQRELGHRKVVDAYLPVSKYLWNIGWSHVGGNDCSHFCAPGALEFVSQLFYNLLLQDYPFAALRPHG